MATLRLAPLLAGFVLSWTLLARGAQASEGEKAVVAQDLFQRGQSAAAAEQWDRACALFDDSLRLDAAAGTRLNLADCEEHRGRIARAWQLYSDVAALVPAADERGSYARARAAALAGRLPRLTLRLAPGLDPATTRIMRDDLMIGPTLLGASLPTDPGVHRVTVEAKGFATRVDRVTVAEGAALEWVLAPGPALPPAPRFPERAASPMRGWGFLLGGVGLASLAASGIAGGLALSAQQRVNDHCDAARRCDDAGLDAARDASRYATAGTVTFAAGAVALGAGLVLVLLAPRPGHATR